MTPKDQQHKMRKLEVLINKIESEIEINSKNKIFRNLDFTL